MRAVAIIFFSFVLLWIFALSSALQAADNLADKGANIAFLRGFVELGERRGDVTFTLELTFGEDNSSKQTKRLLNEFNGGARLNVGDGAVTLPATHCEFVLTNNQTGTVARSSERLLPGSMYSLLAYLDGGQPALRLVREYSPDQIETPGYVIHHLLAGVPLLAAFGENSPRRIAPSAAESVFFQSPDGNTQPLVLTYPSEQGSPRVREIAPVGSGRRILVFLRNGYGQTSVINLPSKPDVEASDPSLSSMNHSFTP